MMNEDELTVTLDEQINTLQLQMLIWDGFSDEYTQMAKNLEVLYGLKLEEMDRDLKLKDLELDFQVRMLKLENEIEEFQKSHGLDINMVVSSATNLIGIFSILTFEKAHVLTSKALSFVKRIK